MKSFFLASFLIVPFALHSQPDTWKTFWKLSRPEKGWVLSHPFKAKRAYLTTRHVRQITDSLFRLQIPDTFRHGGRIDAFRHSYWMALLTHRIGERASRKLGKRHEQGNRIDYRRARSEDGHLQDATACEMDLHNNEQGIGLALQHPAATPGELIPVCLDAIHTGSMKILLINQAGEYCDCQGRPVEMNRRGMDKWKLPICLVSSRRP